MTNQADHPLPRGNRSWCDSNARAYRSHLRDARGAKRSARTERERGPERPDPKGNAQTVLPLDNRAAIEEISYRDLPEPGQQKLKILPVTPHPEEDRIRQGLKRCGSRGIHWMGVVFRSASPRYANKDDLLTGMGSKSAGGRWNPPKSFPTVYSSLDPHTALDEVLAHYRYFSIPIESAMPRVTVSVRIRLARVLDLKNGNTRSALRVSERRMLEEPWRQEQAADREALTQCLGRIGQELGWEGLLVPSAARRSGVNLIVFPTNLSRRNALEIINVGDLPP